LVGRENATAIGAAEVLLPPLGAGIGPRAFAAPVAAEVIFQALAAGEIFAADEALFLDGRGGSGLSDGVVGGLGRGDRIQRRPRRRWSEIILRAAAAAIVLDCALGRDDLSAIGTDDFGIHDATAFSR